MEKLIELLNDYEQWKGEEYGRGNYVRGIDKENKNIFASRFPDGAYICEEESRAIIICKGYEFIKWLVDNEKINLRKLDYKFDSEIPTRYYLGTYIRYPIEKEILMTLAIQDKPIEFLISILK